MRAVLALVLCSSCAVATVTPSSMPSLTIDPSIKGAVISRAAAEVLVEKKISEEANWKKQLVDERARTTSATKRADANDWWGRHGLGLVFGGTAAGAALTAVLFMLFGGK